MEFLQWIKEWVKVSTPGLLTSIAECCSYAFSLILTWIAYKRVISCGTMTPGLRVLICLLLLRTPITLIRRSVVLLERVFIYGEEGLLPYQELNNAVVIFNCFLISCTMVALSFERLARTYARTKTANIDKPATCTLFVLGVVILSFLAAYFETVPTHYVQIGTGLVTCPILGLLLWRNRSWRKKKLDKPLEDKCSFEQNKNGILTVLPIIALILVCSLITLLIECQLLPSSWSWALGYDELLNKNLFSLLIIFEGLLSPLFILANFYRRKKNFLGFTRKCCATRDIEGERDAHFHSLRATWEGVEERTDSHHEIYSIKVQETSL